MSLFSQFAKKNTNPQPVQGPSSRPIVDSIKSFYNPNAIRNRAIDTLIGDTDFSRSLKYKYTFPSTVSPSNSPPSQAAGPVKNQNQVYPGSIKQFSMQINKLSLSNAKMRTQLNNISYDVSSIKKLLVKINANTRANPALNINDNNNQNTSGGASLFGGAAAGAGAIGGGIGIGAAIKGIFKNKGIANVAGEASKILPKTASGVPLITKGAGSIATKLPGIIGKSGKVLGFLGRLGLGASKIFSGPVGWGLLAADIFLSTEIGQKLLNSGIDTVKGFFNNNDASKVQSSTNNTSLDITKNIESSAKSNGIKLDSSNIEIIAAPSGTISFKAAKIIFDTSEIKTLSNTKNPFPSAALPIGNINGSGSLSNITKPMFSNNIIEQDRDALLNMVSPDAERAFRGGEGNGNFVSTGGIGLGIREHLGYSGTTGSATGTNRRNRGGSTGGASTPATVSNENRVSGEGGPAAAVDALETLLGKSEKNPRDLAEINAVLAKGGHKLDASIAPWCAAVLGATFNTHGVKDIPAGSGGNIATSYKNWGRGVDSNKENIAKGDVVVMYPNGRIEAGQTGGHVGLATGRYKRTQSGELEVETIEGNTSDKSKNIYGSETVAKHWRLANKTTIRRATDRELVNNPNPPSNTTDASKSSDTTNKVQKPDAIPSNNVLSDENKNNASMVYKAYKKAGLIPEAAKSFAAEIGSETDFKAKNIFGTHTDNNNGNLNTGMLSWQKDRSPELLERLKAANQVNKDGSIKNTQEAINIMAQYSVDEAQGKTKVSIGKNAQDAYRILQDPNSTPQQRADALGHNIIKWDMDNPKYASHKNKRDDYYSQLGDIGKSIDMETSVKNNKLEPSNIQNADKNTGQSIINRSENIESNKTDRDNNIMQMLQSKQSSDNSSASVDVLNAPPTSGSNVKSYLNKDEGMKSFMKGADDSYYEGTGFLGPITPNTTRYGSGYLKSAEGGTTV